MKSRILLLVFVLVGVLGNAQTAVDSSAEVKAPHKPIICGYPGVLPEFIYPSGFHGYMKANTHYPAEEKKNGIQGTVYISFVVEVDGSVTNVKEAKGVPGGPGLTAEAIRVISGMPKWKPGTEEGKIVRTQMTQPVRFLLSDSTAKPKGEQSHPCGSQIPEDSLGKVYDFAEKMPEFPGGFLAYVVKNLKPPASADATCSTVYVTFIVLEDGRLTNVQIKEGTENCRALQEAVLKVVCEMPPWKPASIKSNPVKCRVTQPVKVDWK